MGIARRNRVSAWASRQREARRAARSRGVPVPGTGVRHFHRSPGGSRNPNGAIHRGNQEWGRKARKWEDHHSIIPAQAEADSIAEQLEALEPDDSQDAYEVYLDELSGNWYDDPQFDREED